MLRLIRPSVKYKKSFIEGEKEFQKEDGGKISEIRKIEKNFLDFIETIRGYETAKKGRVPSSTYWLVDGSEFIGITTIRHKLNAKLMKKGGHIGYGIRPSKRSLGYGKKILALALKKAKKLGLKKILITCGDKNIGSWKIIEANGGILENKIRYKGELLRRYWIII